MRVKLPGSLSSARETSPYLKATPSSGMLAGILLFCLGVLIFVVMVQPWSLRSGSLPLKEGDVAPQDFLAPADFQYKSNALTEEAQQNAERAVEPVYAPPDPAVARAQMENLQIALNYLSAVLFNENATLEQKRSALRSVPGVTFSEEGISNCLLLTPGRWDLVQSETRRVLERVMQDPIRATDLEAKRRNLPSLVSVSLTEREAGLVVDLVAPFVAVNSFYSPELTEATRQAARQAVQPVIRSYVRGQIVVARGQVLTPADLEALTVMGLIEPRGTWLGMVGLAALVSAVVLIAALYHARSRSEALKSLRSLILLGILFLIFLSGARILLPGRTVIPYLYPLPAFALLVSVLFGLESGVIFGLLVSILASFGLSADLLPYYVLTCLSGLLTLGQARRVWAFLRAAMAIGLAGSAMVVAFRLPFGNVSWDWTGIVTLSSAALINGVVSIGLALFLQFLLAQFLGLTTALQLLELSRPDFPLLKYLLLRAPGTYQHSLQVANLAEQAAERIGADGLLTRVGALYHDVGKAANPLFFIENQPPDQLDPHDNLDPEEAAAIIIRHVTDGIKLAAKHRLPRQVQDFIAEHHGTLLARYQYNRALERAGDNVAQVDAARFRYPGPTPRSKETAILMLADSVEARARAQHPKDDEELQEIIRAVIERCQNEGQFAHAPITYHDLTRLADSFLTTLRGTYHPRLEYPAEQPPGEVSPEATSSTLPRRRVTT